MPKKLLVEFSTLPGGRKTEKYRDWCYIFKKEKEEREIEMDEWNP